MEHDQLSFATINQPQSDQHPVFRLTDSDAVGVIGVVD